MPNQAVAELETRLQQATNQHIEVTAPGELLSQDLYFVDTIKGVGKIRARIPGRGQSYQLPLSTSDKDCE